MNIETNSDEYLSPLERIEEEQYFNQLILILAELISRKPQGNRSSSISIFLLLSPSLQLIRVSTILLPVIAALVLLFFDKNEFLLLIILIQGVIIIFAFASSIKYFLEKLIKLYSTAMLNDEEKAKLSLNEVKKDFIAELLTVKKLRNSSIVEKLKFYEIEMDKQVRNTQANEKVVYNLLLVLPLFITSVLVYMYGNKSFDTLSNIVLVPFKLTLIAVYTIVVGVINSLFFRTELDKLNKCLSCIKKAQVN